MNAETEVPNFAAIAEDNPYAGRPRTSLSESMLRAFQRPEWANLYAGIEDPQPLAPRDEPFLPGTSVGVLPARVAEHPRALALTRRRARNKVARATRQAQRA